MNRISQIPVRVETPAVEVSTVAVSLLPFFAAFESMLARLLTDGIGDHLDLRRSPLSNEQRAHLRASLGVGEVQARVDALGMTDFTETGVRGLWWVTHRNPQGETVAEFIESAFIPTLLAATDEDVQHGLKKLRCLKDVSAGAVSG